MLSNEEQELPHWLVADLESMGIRKMPDKKTEEIDLWVDYKPWKPRYSGEQPPF